MPKPTSTKPEEKASPLVTNMPYEIWEFIIKGFLSTKDATRLLLSSKFFQSLVLKSRPNLPSLWPFISKYSEYDTHYSPQKTLYWNETFEKTGSSLYRTKNFRIHGVFKTEKKQLVVCRTHMTPSKHHMLGERTTGIDLWDIAKDTHTSIYESEANESVSGFLELNNGEMIIATYRTLLWFSTDFKLKKQINCYPTISRGIHIIKMIELENNKIFCIFVPRGRTKAIYTKLYLTSGHFSEIDPTSDSVDEIAKKANRCPSTLSLAKLENGNIVSLVSGLDQSHLRVWSPIGDTLNYTSSIITLNSEHLFQQIIPYAGSKIIAAGKAGITLLDVSQKTEPKELCYINIGAGIEAKAYQLVEKLSENILIVIYLQMRENNYSHYEMLLIDLAQKHNQIFFRKILSHQTPDKTGFTYNFGITHNGDMLYSYCNGHDTLSVSKIYGDVIPKKVCKNSFIPRLKQHFSKEDWKQPTTQSISYIHTKKSPESFTEFTSLIEAYKNNKIDELLKHAKSIIAKYGQIIHFNKIFTSSDDYYQSDGKAEVFLDGILFALLEQEQASENFDPNTVKAELSKLLLVFWKLNQLMKSSIPESTAKSIITYAQNLCENKWSFSSFMALINFIFVEKKFNEYDRQQNLRLDKLVGADHSTHFVNMVIAFQKKSIELLKNFINTIDNVAGKREILEKQLFHPLYKINVTPSLIRQFSNIFDSGKNHRFNIQEFNPQIEITKLLSALKTKKSPQPKPSQ